MKPKKKKDHNYRKGTTSSKGNSGKGDRKEESKHKDDTVVSKYGPRPRGPDNDPERQKEEEELVTASTSYAPRKIVNNWSRYEEDGQWSADDDDEQDSNFDGQRKRNVSIGIDFEVALNAAREIGGEFRFRDEREWENLDREVSQESSLGGHSSLDIQDHVLALSCIPLHRKLNIDPTYFTPEMIETYEEVALSNRILLSAKRTANSNSILKTDSNLLSQVEKTESEIILQRAAKEGHEDELDDLLRIAAAEHCRSNDEMSLTTNTSIVQASQRTQSHNNNSNSCSDIQSLEDWLDTVILD